MEKPSAKKSFKIIKYANISSRIAILIHFSNKIYRAKR